MSPLDIQDILERAKGSARVGDHEEASRLLKSYLAKTPDDREAHLLLGATLAKQGKLPEAEDEFNTLLVKNPEDIEALNNIAVIYRRQGKMQDALATLIAAIDIDPVKAEFHYNIGNIHKQLGNLKAAGMAYAKVVELDPNYVPAYNNLGTIYEQLKEYEKAFNMFRKGLSLDRNNPTLHFNYGVALESSGLLSEAAAEYNLALRSKPGWLDPMNNLGIVLFKQGQHTKAMKTFERILATDPFNAEARNNMGVVLADQGRTKDAVQNYRRAIEADPKYVKAVVNLERALEDAGDFSDAVVELEKLVKFTPDSAEVHTRLAGLYLKLERYPEALEEAGAALNWEPENIQALRIEGSVQRVLGNDEEAKAVFEKILSIDPGNYSFHLDLADIHFKRKEYKEAEDRINAFLARRPNDREAKLLLGKLFTEMGNKTHAIQIFEELARADPNDAEALSAAAELYKSAGSQEKALRAADQLVNLQGKRGTSEDLSDLNKSLEFYENAVNTYSSSVKEMWNRNIKLATGAMDAEEEPDENMALLFGAAGMAASMDEETEALFIEDTEAFGEEMLDEDFAVEGDEEPLYDDDSDIDLDNLAENPPGFFPQAPPSQGSPPAPSQAQSPPEAALPPMPPPPAAALPPAAQAPQPPQIPPEVPPPQYPPYPKYPEFPAADEVVEEEDDFPDETLGAESQDDSMGELPIDNEEPEDEISLTDEEENLFEEEEAEDLSDTDSETEPSEEMFVEPDAEPEVEVDPEGEVVPESTDEPEELESAEEDSPEPESAEAGSAAVQSEPSDTGSPELVLQDEKKDDGIKKEETLALMNYLKGLAGSLPDKDRDAFMQSDARLSMEYVIDALEGRKGLIKDIENRTITAPASAAKNVPHSDPPAKLSKMAALRAEADERDKLNPPKKRRKTDVAGMLSFLAHLAGDLPDPNLGQAINRKVDTVISVITESEPEVKQERRNR